MYKSVAQTSRMDLILMITKNLGCGIELWVRVVVLGTCLFRFFLATRNQIDDGTERVCLMLKKRIS